MTGDAGGSLERQNTPRGDLAPGVERLVSNAESLGKLAEASRFLCTLLDDCDHDGK